MVNKIKQKTELPKTILVKSKEIFGSELLQRINIGKQLLTKKIQQVSDLDALKQDFEDWDDYNKELIKRAFNNQNSEYYKDYAQKGQMISSLVFHSGANVNRFAESIKETYGKINYCITTLNQLLQKLPLIEQDDSTTSLDAQEKVFYNQGFIVHGHDDIVKFEVARFIDNDLKLKAIILHEQPNKGQTIIEKFESNSKVDFAVALWTADDFGKAKNETDLHSRTRQNVIFETGFFIGLLGRKKVIVLYEDGVEIMSDYSGVIFIRLADNWKNDLRKEIEEIYQ